tara:strand:+ start:2196 stop:2912 length:717 start_codon:yes stop_codon:yes gene_type:complete
MVEAHNSFPRPLMDDVDAWKAYPQNSWIFNKLELALTLGYDAGPACVPISKKGKYIIRPIYNLYGMGIDAKVIELDPEKDSQAIRDHAYLSPSHFWCEYFEGDHVSVDYKKTTNSIGNTSAYPWEPIHAMRGKVNDKNLRLFESWERIEVPKECQYLPHWFPDDVDDLNVEWRGEHIIEVHLRSGNDAMYDMDIGEFLYPVFNVSEKRFGTFVGNDDPEGDYSASGILSEIREGYIRD